MTEKIIKIGSSLGIILPPIVLETLHVGIGDDVEISVNIDTKEIIISKIVK
jgi:antitoxin component of MazEF toxin-antitoxin module